MPEHNFRAWPNPVRWGELAQLPDGRWLTSWTIELESLDLTNLADVVARATNLEAGFTPTLTPYGQANFLVTIETSRWGMESDYYGLTYQLFRLIDSQLGRVRFIQGAPRNWRYPFVSE